MFLPYCRAFAHLCKIGRPKRKPFMSLCAHLHLQRKKTRAKLVHECAIIQQHALGQWMLQFCELQLHIRLTSSLHHTPSFSECSQLSTFMHTLLILPHDCRFAQSRCNYSLYKHTLIPSLLAAALHSSLSAGHA